MMPAPLNGRPITRRRSRSQMESIRCAIETVLGELNPMTVRQLFYQLVSRGVIPKTELAYKGTVVRLLTEMRLSGRIPFGWIADNTRWMRKPRSYSSLAEMLQRSTEFYRRALWDEQDAYVEVWLEKDALAGVLYDVTALWDVPLMVTRGYPSLSYLHEAAESIQHQGKPCFLYYLGDHDPSGLDIPRTVEQRIREFAPGADITFERIAVNEKQIAEFRLPTRPTKKTDSRAKSFEGESVEVDALPPHVLRGIVREHIEQHVDQGRLSRLQAVEDAERQTLADMIERMGV